MGELRSRDAPSTVPPGQCDRNNILHALAALIAGVTRVTTSAVLGPDQARLAEITCAALAATRERDAVRESACAWALVELLLSLCPNAFLAATTRSAIAALELVDNRTCHIDVPCWGKLEDGYLRLLDTVRTTDAIAAERALKTVFGL